MGRIITYKNLNGRTKQYEFGDEFHKVKLEENADGPGMVLIGLSDEESKLIEGVDEVIADSEHILSS
jgi:hypothetical protein